MMAGRAGRRYRDSPEADEFDVEMVEFIQHIEEVPDGSGDRSEARQEPVGSGLGGHPATAHRDQAGELWFPKSGQCTRRRSENPAAGPSRRVESRDAGRHWIRADTRLRSSYLFADRNTIKVHVKKLAVQHNLIQVGKGRGARYTIK